MTQQTEQPLATSSSSSSSCTSTPSSPGPSVELLQMEASGAPSDSVAIEMPASNKSDKTPAAAAAGTPAEAPWRLRDLLGFLALGLLSDALPGFFFSGTILHSLVPNDDQAILSLSADSGGLLGLLALSLVLYKVHPDARVAGFLCLQAIGMLLCWLLPYPASMVGVGVLTFGFAATLATVLSLTSLKHKVVTRTFQFGTGVAPVLGAALIQVGLAAGFGKDGLFSMALCMPLLVGVIFFLVIDRSPWRKQASQQRQDGEGQGEELQQAPTLSQRWSAFVEAKFYMILFAASVAVRGFFQECLLVPFTSIVASSNSLLGPDLLDQTQLIAHTCVFFVGLTAFLKPLSRQNRNWLWLPVAVLLGCCTVGLLQLTGELPPLPVWAFTLVACLAMSSYYFVNVQLPLFMREDAALSVSNLEAQLQLTFLVYQIVSISTDLVYVWLNNPSTGAVHALCEDGAARLYSVHCALS